MQITKSNVRGLTQEAMEMQEKFAAKVPGTTLRDSRPLFTVYYRIDKSSTSSAGFKDVEAFVGEDSPIRFNQVKNLALFGRDKPSGTSERDDEKGITYGETKFTVELPAGVFEPKEGEMFTYYHEDHTILYRVTKVDEDIIHNNPTHILECDVKYLAVDRDTTPVGDVLEYDELMKQVINKYTAIFENIGTDAAVIVADDTYALLERGREYILDGSKAYCEYFMSEVVNNVVFEYDVLDDNMTDYETNYYYNNFLCSFIDKYDGVLYRGNEFFSTNDLPRHRAYDARYRKSFYEYILDRKGMAVYEEDDSFYSPYGMMYYSPYIALRGTIYNVMDFRAKKVEEGDSLELLGRFDKVIAKWVSGEEFIESDLDIINPDHIEFKKEDFLLYPLVMVIMRRYLDSKLTGTYLYHNNDKMSRRF